MELATAFVTIRPQTDGFESELASAVGGIDAEPVELEAVADVSDAESEIESIDGGTTETTVTADTAQAEEQIGGLSASVDSLMDAVGGGGGGAAGALDGFAGAAGLAGGASSIAATGGIAALAAGLGFAVSEATDAQVAMVQLDQMVANMGANAGVTSEGLQAMATDLQTTAGFSDEAVMSGQAMVLMFENVRNVAGQPIFDRAIQSSADLARSPAFSGDIAGAARTLGRALDDPVSGMSRLRRAGIQLTESQEATITSLQESGDVAGAQAALLDVVESKVGGLAAAYGDTLAGDIDKATESMGESAEEIGATLIPALAGLMEFLGGAAKGYRDIKDDWVDPGEAFALSMGGDIENFKGTVTGIPAALRPATDAVDEFTAAQQAANDAVAATLPTLGGIIGQVDAAGRAFGVLNASSDPSVVIENLRLALFAWDDFDANIKKIDDWGPRISGALQQLGPEVAGGLTNALAEGNIATIVQLDGLIAEIEARGGQASAVLTGFAQTGMDGAVAAVAGAAGPMGAAGTQAGASGAAGIDAGLTFTNAAAIGAITGTQYGAGVASGISGMYATVNAVATNMISGAGNISSAFSRGQALGSAYGSGIVAGLAGQVGNAAATKASLDAIVENFGAGVGRSSVSSVAPAALQPVQVVLDGQVVAEASFEHNRRLAMAEGYEQP